MACSVLLNLSFSRGDLLAQSIRVKSRAGRAEEGYPIHPSSFFFSRLFSVELGSDERRKRIQPEVFSFREKKLSVSFQPVFFPSSSFFH